MKFLRRAILLGIAAVVLVWLFLPSPGLHIEPGSTLSFELSGTYVEAAEAPLLDRLMGDGRLPFASVLSELAKAQRDARLAVVVLRIRDLDVGWGMAQELRDAIGELRQSGRRTQAYLETGSLGANLEYYVASAADEVVIAPATSSPLVGLAMEYLFLGGLWEKLGAGVEAIGSGEYKSGAETLAGTKMSDPHREMATWLLDSTWEQFVAGIAQGRKLEPAYVRETIDAAPVTPEELVGVGLADAVLSFDAALARAGTGAVVEADDYAGVDPASVGFAPVANFALIYGSGTVSMGEGTRSPTGGFVLTSDTVSQALLDAADDPDIRAIVFRIDSPGGSPLASDVVWRAVEQAREKGKPVVASVSNMAASGGYYVLCGADAVVAPPGSLVGSIGVFAMRPVIGGLLEKLGIGFETMTRGAHADLLLSTQPLSEGGRERLLREITGLYDVFVARVAKGRGLEPAQVDDIGRGRVWTGAQGLERGLVDELGGLRAAVRRAKREAGLPDDADVALVPYPAPQTLADQLAEALRQTAVRAAQPLPVPRLLARLEGLIGPLAEGGPLLVPPFVMEIR